MIVRLVKDSMFTQSLNNVYKVTFFQILFFQILILLATTFLTFQMKNLQSFWHSFSLLQKKKHHLALTFGMTTKLQERLKMYFGTIIHL